MSVYYIIPCTYSLKPIFMWEKKREWLELCQCENYTIFTKFWLKKPGRVLLTKNHWIPKELHEVKTEWDKKINYCVEYPPKELPTKFSPFFGNWLSRATQHKAGPRSKLQESSSTHHAKTSQSQSTPDPKTGVQNSHGKTITNNIATLLCNKKQANNLLAPQNQQTL